GKPECAFGIDGRRSADALTLSRPIDHRRVTSLGPSLSMHRISAEARFVPEVNFGTLRFGLPCNGGKGVTLPSFNGLRVALVGALQRLLRSEVEFGKQATDRGHAQTDIEFLEDEFTHDVPRPQSKFKAVLHRVLAVDPAEHLRFLSARQFRRTPSAFACDQAVLPATPSTDLGEPLVSRGAAQPIAVHHHRNLLPLKNALHRHHADSFFCFSIMSSSIFLHERLEFA